MHRSKYEKSLVWEPLFAISLSQIFNNEKTRKWPRVMTQRRLGSIVVDFEAIYMARVKYNQPWSLKKT